MSEKIYCSVDIGGSKILLLLIDDQGNVLFKEKRATPRPEEPTAIAATIESMLSDAASTDNDYSFRKPSGLGVAIAGFVDHRSGLVHQSPNLHWVNPVPLGEILEETFKCPVMIENDANAAVVGEVCYGAAHGHRNVIYITISTGIGGGLFLDGRLYRGATGFAGEIGHIKPFGKGRPCKCGGYDCLETWASGNAISHSAELLWDKNDFPVNEIDTAWVFQQSESGNPIAKTIIDHAINNIGRGLANLVNLLNPSCLVIGGGVAGNRPDFLEEVKSRIVAESIRPSVNITPFQVFAAMLEPEAGIWGMYALLTERMVQ
ncbi:MAG: ROK family protein [Bacillota bacterium]